MPLELASLSEDKRREKETNECQEKEGKEAEVDEVVYITMIYRTGYMSANDILRFCL